MLPKVDDILEPSFVEQGQTDVYRDGRVARAIPEKSLQVFCNHETLEMRSDAPLHRHILIREIIREIIH